MKADVAQFKPSCPMRTPNAARRASRRRSTTSGEDRNPAEEGQGSAGSVRSAAEDEERAAQEERRCRREGDQGAGAHTPLTRCHLAGIHMTTNTLSQEVSRRAGFWSIFIGFLHRGDQRPYDRLPARDRRLFHGVHRFIADRSGRRAIRLRVHIADRRQLLPEAPARRPVRRLRRGHRGLSSGRRRDPHRCSRGDADRGGRRGDRHGLLAARRRGTGLVLPKPFYKPRSRRDDSFAQWPSSSAWAIGTLVGVAV